MSSDDDLHGTDARRRSLVSPQPPSAGGLGPESPTVENVDEDDNKRTSMEGTGHTTANEVANTDEEVRRVIYSDV
jgi:hypothetical protein